MVIDHCITKLLTMVEQMSIIGLVAVFISLAIFLSIGIMLLDSAKSNCSILEGYNSSNPSASTGWSGACEANNEKISGTYAMLTITMIVVASVIVLVIIRMI